MDSIQVIYNKGIQALYMKLGRKSFDVTKLNKESMVVSFRDKEEYEEFIDILKRYLIKENFNKQIKQILKNKGYEEDFIKEFLKDKNIRSADKVSYFNILTEILLNEYFKNMKVISLNSFMVLNMVGFENEVLLIVEKTEELMNDRVEDEQGLLYLEVLREAVENFVTDNKIEKDNFSKITIVMTEEENVSILDVNKNVYSIDSISELMGIGISSDSKEDHLQIATLLSVIIISVMGTKKIRINKSQKKLKDMILSFLPIIGADVEIEEF